jgi:hypothetical protein
MARKPRSPRTSSGRKSTDEVQLKLRFDEDLRGRLERAAWNKGRSLNAEIIHRLRESFEYDFIQWQAHNVIQRSQWDSSRVEEMARNMIGDIIKLIVKEMAQAEVAAKRQKAKSKDESK